MKKSIMTWDKKTQQYIDENTVILETCIPEGHHVHGLTYGDRVDGIGWDGYYVRIGANGPWGVARMMPPGEQWPMPDSGEDEDGAISRCIASELESVT